MTILIRPLGLSPTILSSIKSSTNYSLEHRVLSSDFFFLLLKRKILASPTKAIISSFVFLSFQLTCSIHLQIHISKPLTCQVFPESLYKSRNLCATVQFSVFTIRYLHSFYKRVVTSSFVLLKATFANCILDFTSSIPVPFSVIIAPR